MRNLKNIKDLNNKINLITQSTNENTFLLGPEAVDNENLYFHNNSSKSVLEQANQFKNINRLSNKVNILQIGDYKEINYKFISETTQDLVENTTIKNTQIKKVSGSQLLQLESKPRLANRESSINTETNSINKELRKRHTINMYSHINLISKFNAKLASNQFSFYIFNKGSQLSNYYLFKEATNIIALTFLTMGCLISKPIFKIIYTKNNLEENYSESHLQNNTKKIIIQLFYYVKYRKGLKNMSSSAKRSKFNNNYRGIVLKNIYQKYPSNLQNLSDFLTNLFNCEIELELINLNKPYYNSNILVQHLAL
jgi:hypothetical protein